MYSRLIKRLNKNNILSNHQFGFRANLGTDNAIFRLIFEILNSLNHKTLVSGIYCDLEKAFDRVSNEVQGGSNMTRTNCDLFTNKSSRSYLNHLVLLDKLKYYGINDKQYNIYKSYLQDRFQRT
jgi:hypothetical protein